MKLVRMKLVRMLAAIALCLSLPSIANAQAQIQIPCDCEAAVDVVLIAQGASAFGNIVPTDGPCTPLTASTNSDGSLTVSGCDNGEGCQFTGSVTFTGSDGGSATVSGQNLSCDSFQSFPAEDANNNLLGVVIEKRTVCKLQF